METGTGLAPGDPVVEQRNFSILYASMGTEHGSGDGDIWPDRLLRAPPATDTENFFSVQAGPTSIRPKVLLEPHSPSPSPPFPSIPPFLISFWEVIDKVGLFALAFTGPKMRCWFGAIPKQFLRKQSKQNQVYFPASKFSYGVISLGNNDKEKWPPISIFKACFYE